VIAGCADEVLETGERRRAEGAGAGTGDVPRAVCGGAVQRVVARAAVDADRERERADVDADRVASAELVLKVTAWWPQHRIMARRSDVVVPRACRQHDGEVRVALRAEGRLGRLAQRLGRPFVDLDDVIEANAGRSVAEIFSSEARVGLPGA